MSLKKAHEVIGEPTQPLRSISHALYDETTAVGIATTLAAVPALVITVPAWGFGGLVAFAACVAIPFVYFFARRSQLRKKDELTFQTSKALSLIDELLQHVRLLALTPTLREVPEALDAARDALTLRESALEEMIRLDRQVRSGDVAASTAEVTRKEITDSVEGVLKQMISSLTLLKEEREVSVDALTAVEPSEVFSSRLARTQEAAQEVELRKDALKGARSELRAVSPPPARSLLR